MKTFLIRTKAKPHFYVHAIRGALSVSFIADKYYAESFPNEGHDRNAEMLKGITEQAFVGGSFPPDALEIYFEKEGEPIRYEKPTPFTLWVEGFAWWTEGIYVSNRKQYEFAGLEIGRIARAAHRGKGNRHFTGLPTIAIKLLPKTKRHW